MHHLIIGFTPIIPRSMELKKFHSLYSALVLLGIVILRLITFTFWDCLLRGMFGGYGIYTLKNYIFFLIFIENRIVLKKNKSIILL